MQKQVLSLNNQLWLVCHKTQTNPTNQNKTKHNTYQLLLFTFYQLSFTFYLVSRTFYLALITFTFYIFTFFTYQFSVDDEAIKRKKSTNFPLKELST